MQWPPLHVWPLPQSLLPVHPGTHAPSVGLHEHVTLSQTMPLPASLQSASTLHAGLGATHAPQPDTAPPGAHWSPIAH